MTDDCFDQIREKDHVVLQCIRDGYDTTRAIRDETTLSNRDVNYAFDKLEDLGLIETVTPDHRVTAVVDGQKRNFKAPREAALTSRGQDYFAWTDRDRTKYRTMTHDDLVERVRALEQRIEEIQDTFEAFRQQVLKKLE